MPFTGFPKETFGFLAGLAKNNSKEWFEAHRGDYEAYHLGPAKAFVAAIGPKLKSVSKSAHAEPKVNGSIFRINRDMRFSKDKRPYKTTLDLWFWEGEKRGWESPGFFLRLMPETFIAGAGMHQFTPDQLKRFRAAVIDAKVGGALEKMVTGLAGVKLGEAARKTVPRGFDAAHPRAAFLLHEGLHAVREGPLPPSVHGSKFVDDCIDIFRSAAPVSRWLFKYVVDA